MFEQSRNQFHIISPIIRKENCQHFMQAYDKQDLTQREKCVSPEPVGPSNTILLFSSLMSACVESSTSPPLFSGGACWFNCCCMEAPRAFPWGLIPAICRSSTTNLKKQILHFQICNYSWNQGKKIIIIVVSTAILIYSHLSFFPTNLRKSSKYSKW